MKYLYGSLFILLSFNTAFAQWSNFGYAAHVYTLHAHQGSLYAGVSPGRVERFEPDLSGWHPVDTGLQGANIVSMRSIGTQLFASSDAGVVYVSSDTAATWHTLMVNGPIATNDTYLFGTDNITGTDPHIRRSPNGGKTWEEVLDANATYIHSHGACVMAIMGSTLWKSVDTGRSQTWLSKSLPIKDLRSIEFVNSVAIAANGVAGEGIVLSIDSGNNWTGLAWPGRSVFALAASNNALFAGTDSGVYVSTNEGGNWKSVNDGFGRVSKVNNLCIFDTLLVISLTLDNHDLIYYRPLNQMAPPKSDVQLAAIKDTISIYPNPTFSSIRIDFGSAAVRRVELLDVLGESKQVLAPRESSLTLDLAPLPSGTYFLRFETEKGIEMKKIMKE